jgi:thiamine pyrophosphate-dependent acetolactate synthase large subunit-like protein
MGAIIFIINNNGIFTGTEALEGKPSEYSVTYLNPETKYEKLGEAFGGKGCDIKTIAQL